MQLRMFQTRWVTVKRDAVERLAKCERERLCCGCLEPLGEELGTRGLHVRCYHATRRAILAGKTTEEDRISQGKLLEARQRGRKPSNAVSIDVA